MADWLNHPPQLYSIVTGFFPEVRPKEIWSSNPRPLLVCGRGLDEATKTYFCRIAYGTTQKLDNAHSSDLVIANLGILNQLNLKLPTKFVIHSGRQMVILPWNEQHFQPWTGFSSPVLSVLPTDMQRYVGYTLAELNDLPDF